MHRIAAGKMKPTYVIEFPVAGALNRDITVYFLFADDGTTPDKVLPVERFAAMEFVTEDSARIVARGWSDPATHELVRACIAGRNLLDERF